MYIRFNQIITVLFFVGTAISTSIQAQAAALSSTEKSFIFDGEASSKVLTKEKMKKIEGRAAPLIAIVVMHGGRMIVQRWVSTRAAATIARQGGNLWAPTRQSANALARQVSRGGARPIREFHSGTGRRFTHFHSNPRNGSHVWYGTARQYGFVGTIGAPSVAAWGAFTGKARANYDENRTCDYSCHRATTKIQIPEVAPQENFGYPVTSVGFATWKDQRDRGIVKQRFDYTCGAASVATILKYFYNTPLEEVDVLTQLEDEEQYSFDDLSQVVTKWGYKGVGLLATFDDLKQLKIPVIAHISYRGQDHFTVIRGVNEDGTVRLADSSFGNRRMREAEFRSYWERDSMGSLMALVPENIAAANINKHYFGSFDKFDTLLRSYLFDGPLSVPEVHKY